MTDTITATTEGEQHSGDGERSPSGTLEHINPHDLVLDDNVRDDADLDAEFVASVKEHGVIQPIVAVRGDDGVVRVRFGQRRTMAAREVGLPTVPVYVLPATTGDDKAKLAERVAKQIVENDKRRKITDAQRVKGIQQMLDAGVSASKVAKKLSVKRDTVKAAEAAGKSGAAMNALGNGQLSLEEAAAVSEFEGDDAAVNTLIEVAGTRRFEHRVQELRQARESQRAYDAAVAEYTERGYQVIEDSPAWSDTSCVALDHLHTADGERAPETAMTDPGHWAVILYEEDGYADAETGEIVAGESIDWSTQDDPEAQPQEGLRHADSVVDKTIYVPEYFCTDYRAAGLALSPSMLPPGGRPSSDAATDPDASDEDKARAAAEAEAARADALRRERKKVIALNRLGDAAMHVRREFVRKLLARKTAPKGAAIFVATCLTREAALINDYHGAAVTADLLGIESSSTLVKLVTDLPPTGDGRAQVITLGVVLGALESRTPKDAWRSGGVSGYGHSVRSGEYLAFLVANGYQLAEVERVIVGERSGDEVYDETLSAGEDTEPESDDGVEDTEPDTGDDPDSDQQ
ncbi:ParB/RepB/Spo0J family partition protein [Mycolicibacterium gadium]|jgi:ParB family chromosome partitioning protein|uniref:ParB/RepB/Spo0J family partition protein n=1 Tax=Mycolicibacterium gadium TaxID=1794 RepID=UPI002FDEC096